MARPAVGDSWKEVEGAELPVFDAAGPRGFEANPLAILEPECDLLDCGIFQVGWKPQLGPRRGKGKRGSEPIGMKNELPGNRHEEARKKHKKQKLSFRVCSFVVVAMGFLTRL